MIEKLSCSDCESVQDCEYVSQIEETEMKGVSINYIAEFYRCLSCGNEFFIPGMTDKNLDAIMRSYLIKMGIDPLNMDRRQLVDAVKLVGNRCQ
jgi:hypothetical protein